MEHLEALEEALYADAARTPGGTFVRTDTWVQLTTPDAKTHFRNGVYRSVLSEDEADARIESVIRHYAALDLPFRWVVTPSSRPRDLPDRLATHGFTLFETVRAMCDFDQWKGAPA